MISTHVRERRRQLRVDQEPHTRLIELTVGLLAARGARSVGQLAAEVHPLLGHRWRLGGRPLAIDDVRMQTYSRSAIMSGLDLIDTSDRGAWAAGPATAAWHRCAGGVFANE